MARRRRKRPCAKPEAMRRRTLASDLSPAKHIPSDDYYSSEETGKRQKLEQRQEEAADKSGEQEHGEETDLLQDDVTLLTSLIYPGSQDQLKQSLGQRSHPEEDEEEEEENESPILVTCDRNEGRLYLSKLRVVVNERCRTKCIRTGSTWWTPNEFQFVSGRGAAKDWKRTVKHNGQCLKTLLTKGTISLNAIPPKCFCKSCELLKEEGKASSSSVDQKERQQELAPSLCSALETQDVAGVDGVKVESGGHEMKRSKLRTIKGHRCPKRDIRDIEDRKRRPSGLPVKRKKLRKSRPEPVLDDVLEERQGHVEGLLDLQEVRDRQGSLVFRLSSSSFEHVIRSPNDVTSRSSNRLNSVSAFEGQCSGDHDATRSVPVEAKAEQELPAGNISEEHSVCERPSDDVIVREPSKTPTSSQETKEEAHLNTGRDVGQLPSSSSSTSSFVSYQCNEMAPEAPEAHVDAEPEADVAQSVSDDTCTATDKNSKGNVIGDGEDDVTVGAVSDVTSLTSSSPAASVTTATRRKSAYLSAVIEELRRRKRSREAEVIAPDASGAGGGGGGGGIEGQKMAAAASVTLSSLMISPMAESMKSEIDDRTGATCAPPPAKSFDGLSDVMTSCPKPNPTGGGGGGGGGVSLVHDHPESREERNSSGLRKSDPESSDRKKAFHPPPSLQAAWLTTPSKVEADRKQEVVASSSDRKFGISRGKPEPRVTSSFDTMTSPLNISHLASIYGLNASPLTSLPLSPLQFPFFPPYLFMGFPLHPLLPQFSSTSGASLPVAVPPPVTSSNFGSSSQQQKQQQQKQRRVSQQSPCGGSSLAAADHFGSLLLRPRPAASNNGSSQLHMMWRPLVTDFSSADQWTTGRPLAVNATGNSKPHSGTARHPIWRPEMAPQSPSLRKYSQRSFEEKTTAQRPRAQKEAEMTSSVAANNRYKSEFLVSANVSRKLRSGEKEEEEEAVGGRAGKSAPGAYSCDAQGVLDLSSK